MKHVAIAFYVVVISSGLLRVPSQVTLSSSFTSQSTSSISALRPSSSPSQRPRPKAIMGPRKAKSDASACAEGKFVVETAVMAGRGLTVTRHNNDPRLSS